MSKTPAIDKWVIGHEYFDCFDGSKIEIWYLEEVETGSVHEGGFESEAAAAEFLLKCIQECKND